ncbi:hypothetical protein [Streptomyces sp. 5-6(2022)]|uniref:hypothetical protein n=1 Tax=Streptomyces sp. 5-6(2022) TaxID=2936510 RepID=UPI0023BA2EB9|nr:hypothetical protein [Streptomyces sp. 5-6(2022)]
MQKLRGALLAASMMVALGFQGTAAAAPAATEAGDVSIMDWPTDCYYGKFSDGTQAECEKSNGGSYKAVVICTRYDNFEKVVHEPQLWRTSGISYAFCPMGTFYSSSGIKTRASS